jgi:hypothetical protein
MEVLRVLGISIAAGGIALVVSMLVGVTLLELPYSLSFAVCIAVLLVLLGALLIINMVWSWRASAAAAAAARAAAAAKTPSGDAGGGAAAGGGAVGEAAGGAVLALEIAILALLGLLTVAGGAFALLIYFYSTTLPPAARMGMCVPRGRGRGARPRARRARAPPPPLSLAPRLPARPARALQVLRARRVGDDHCVDQHPGLGGDGAARVLGAARGRADGEQAGPAPAAHARAKLAAAFCRAGHGRLLRLRLRHHHRLCASFGVDVGALQPVAKGRAVF